MPKQNVDRGHTINLGARIVHTAITLNGDGAPYSITICPGPAVVGTAAPGNPVVYPVNNLAVSLTNTTAPPGAPNLQVTW